MKKPQTWLITGGSRGLGKALTEQALAAGHCVLATVRGDHTLTDHERLTIHRLDVRDRHRGHEAVKRAVQVYGGLDVLVNNAGYGLVGAIEEVNEEEAREILDTDLLGALWLSQAAISVMRDQRSGHIVQISTTGAVGAMPTFGLYNAAKWALEGFSEALAGEVASFGIRVTIAELGAIDTEWGTASMRFSQPMAAYDDLRSSIFGTSKVPWPTPTANTGGGTSPADAAAAILRHVEEPDSRLRLLVGDDAPGQVATVMGMRCEDYNRDPRFRSADPA